MRNGRKSKKHRFLRVGKVGNGENERAWRGGENKRGGGCIASEWVAYDIEQRGLRRPERKKKRGKAKGGEEWWGAMCCRARGSLLRGSGNNMGFGMMVGGLLWTVKGKIASSVSVMWEELKGRRGDRKKSPFSVNASPLQGDGFGRRRHEISSL